MSIEKALNPIEMYYQEYPEERDMSEAYQHRAVSVYVETLLRWYYRGEICLVTANLVIYTATIKVSPDVALIKGVQLALTDQSEEVLGWEVSPPERPAPAWVLEVSSRENWDKDIDPTKNRRKYGELGVKEYIAFDPLQYWGGEVRLRGWRYHDGQAVEIEPNADGWLWSEQLGLWMAVENVNLRLHTADGSRLMTEAEQERARGDQERARGDQERAKLQALLDKLQAKGIDPNTL